MTKNIDFSQNEFQDCFRVVSAPENVKITQKMFFGQTKARMANLILDS